MPDVLLGYDELRALGSDQPEGPWFLIRAMQLQQLADLAGDDPHATVKLEYRGDGYWQVERIRPARP